MRGRYLVAVVVREKEIMQYFLKCLDACICVINRWRNRIRLLLIEMAISSTYINVLLYRRRRNLGPLGTYLSKYKFAIVTALRIKSKALINVRRNVVIVRSVVNPPNIWALGRG
jgi:hypothetical protein